MPPRSRIVTSAGVTISYSKYGSGPPLVLVHGGFSDDETNWEFVKPMLQERFSVHAIARRGRGETDATSGHRVEDEAGDVQALMETIGEPVFLLGHSYGAQCALAAAARAPQRVRKLVLYEPPWPHVITAEAFDRLQALASSGAWDALATTFFRDTLFVPAAEVDAQRASDLWPPIVADARASMEDVRAVHVYAFDPARFADLHVPVLLQTGSESLHRLYATDALASALPDVRVETLQGQAHEGMTTGPAQYAAAITRFLLE